MVRCLPVTIFCRGKAIIIEYSECVSVALGIQHVRRMRRIILSSVPCMALPCSSTFSQTARRSEKIMEHKMCVLIFLQLCSEKFRIQSRIQLDIIIGVHRSSCKLPFIICQILIKLESSLQIFEKSSNIKFH